MLWIPWGVFYKMHASDLNLVEIWRFYDKYREACPHEKMFHGISTVAKWGKTDPESHKHDVAKICFWKVPYLMWKIVRNRLVLVLHAANYCKGPFCPIFSKKQGFSLFKVPLCKVRLSKKAKTNVKLFKNHMMLVSCAENGCKCPFCPIFWERNKVFSIQSAALLSATVQNNQILF